MGIPTKKRMREWAKVPSVLETSVGKPVEGMIVYGARMPMKSSTHPIIECPIGTRGTISGQKIHYWFVTEDQATKVRLPFIYSVNDERVKAIGYDMKFFLATIRKPAEKPKENRLFG